MKTSGFPILNLPLLPLCEVIQLMTLHERIKLALSAKIMEAVVQAAKPKISFLELVFRGEKSHVHFEDHVALFCGKNVLAKEVEIMKNTEILPWLHPNLSVVENTMNVSQKIRSMMPTDFLSIVIYLTQTCSLREVLNIAEAKNNCHCIAVFGSDISREDLDLVMQLSHRRRNIQLGVDRIPEDYTHRNSFKFCGIYYKNASWLKLDNLLAMKNCNLVTLGKITLPVSDINKLMKYWMDCDYDMFECLTMKFKGKVKIEKDIMFEGIPVLRVERSGKFYYLVLSKPSATRKFAILTLTWKRSIVFKAEQVGESWSRESEILTTLKQKKNLESQLERIQQKKGIRHLRCYQIQESIQNLRMNLEANGLNIDRLIPRL